MATQNESLWLEHRRLQEKRLYFFLAAAGTCIGFAMTQIGAVTPSRAIYFLIVALICLGLSIVAGIRTLFFEERFLLTNIQYLEFMQKQQAIGNDLAAAESWVRDEKFSPIDQEKQFWSRLQSIALFTGAALLPIWRIAECEDCLAAMYLWSSP